MRIHWLAVKEQDDCRLKNAVVIMTADFIPVGELECSNSGKTVKVYLFVNGKRCFIGQVTCESLIELINRHSLTTGLFKYQTGEECKQ
jgi:hypothetical protein